MKLVKILKKNKLDACSFSISLFLLIILLIFVKTFFIYQSFKYLFPLKHCLEYLVSDFYFLVTIAFFVIVNLNVKIKIIRGINNILILFFILLFYIDIFTIHYFQSHETIISIVRTVSYWWFWFTWFAIWRFIALIIGWVLIYFLCNKCLNRNLTKIFTLGFFVICFVWCLIAYFSESPVKDILFYDRKNILFINIQAFRELKSINTSYNGSYYKDYMVSETWEWKDLNIILIFGESLSAIDSANMWWNDNMPYLDKIQQDGITFTNFISQWTKSCQSHIGTLLWFLWIEDHYFFCNDFKLCHDAWLPHFLNNQWYKTTFISTAPLYFLNQRLFLQNIWFQQIIGAEDFENKQKYVFSSAPDWDLYDRIIKEIETQTWKYFIWAQTISFHEPYTSPYCTSVNNCMHKTLQYTDEKLYDFYTSLQKMWFFESGILIILWDHRKREPAEQWEFDLFWLVWGYKSIATIVWSWVQSWTINENVTQPIDFYYSI